MVPKIKIEVACASDLADRVVEAIQASANTGAIGDGKIFVLDVGPVSYTHLDVYKRQIPHREHAPLPRAAIIAISIPRIIRSPWSPSPTRSPCANRSTRWRGHAIHASLRSPSRSQDPGR